MAEIIPDDGSYDPNLYCSLVKLAHWLRDWLAAINRETTLSY